MWLLLPDVSKLKYAGLNLGSIVQKIGRSHSLNFAAAMQKWEVIVIDNHDKIAEYIGVCINIVQSIRDYWYAVVIDLARIIMRISDYVVQVSGCWREGATLLIGSCYQFQSVIIGQIRMSI